MCISFGHQLHRYVAARANAAPQGLAGTRAGSAWSWAGVEGRRNGWR